jgi:hypothetical protein
MLATVTFDGFRETPAWAGMLGWIGSERTLRGALLTLHGLGVDLLALVETLALLGFPLAFALVYAGFCWLAARAGARRVSAGRLVQGLVLTLVPISFAYHVAHYLSYLMLAGQLVVPLASDPFGSGWDLLGTAGYRLDLAVFDARAAWYVALGVIVAGHVAAVWLADREALALFGDVAAARRSQYPVILLMVAYTMTSLWILSQPIVLAAR